MTILPKCSCEFWFKKNSACPLYKNAHPKEIVSNSKEDSDDRPTLQLYVLKRHGDFDQYPNRRIAHPFISIKKRRIATSHFEKETALRFRGGLALSYRRFALGDRLGRSDWQRFRVNNVGPRSVLVFGRSVLRRFCPYFPHKTTEHLYLAANTTEIIPDQKIRTQNRKLAFGAIWGEFCFRNYPRKENSRP